MDRASGITARHKNLVIAASLLCSGSGQRSLAALGEFVGDGLILLASQRIKEQTNRRREEEQTSINARGKNNAALRSCRLYVSSGNQSVDRQQLPRYETAEGQPSPQSENDTARNCSGRAAPGFPFAKISNVAHHCP